MLGNIPSLGWCRAAGAVHPRIIIFLYLAMETEKSCKLHCPLSGLQESILNCSQGGSLSSNLKVICQEKALSHFSFVTIWPSKTIVATFFIWGIMRYVYTIQAEYLHLLFTDNLPPNTKNIFHLSCVTTCSSKNIVANFFCWGKYCI